jgi:hypothetical protein
MSWKHHNPKFEYEGIYKDAGWPWAGHKYFAYDLVANIKPKRIVELGTHYGTSLWAFSQSVKDQQIDTEIYAVDTWKGEKHAGFYGEEVFEEVKEIQKRYYKDLEIKLIRKTFDEATADFQDESIELLHIDGLHTYEAVKRDFEKWNPKVKDDGIIIFHDVFINRDDFGVYRFWEELKKKYKTIEFYHSFGLGVLFKDGNKYEDFIKDEKNLQMRYSALSEDRKNQMINTYLDVIQKKDTELQKKDTELQKKDTELQKKDREVEMMKSSKFWKMRGKYLNIKGAIISRGDTKKKND